ncbi:PQQ-binding-like beta-propeller repeat protein [Pyxidicoccus trucidator]|uniref:PQQ-binding-like beta-propeller repeat protein n=1 Tax=Pyxidicoccus trucidator TaxID=2709662 RepID=UPI001F0779A5|nr:PQQ-binding-like beta-propeller repeat protein [Pyxidicoccus trucidator]
MLRKPLLSLLLLLGAPVFLAACSDSDEQKPDPAVLIIDRPSLDFGELEVGQSSPEYLFTVRNASAYAVESVSVVVEGSGFSIATNTCERFLDAGLECEVRVKFTPRLAGPNEARLKVQGAPDVDEAVLTGMAVAWVDVQDLPGGGARVVAEAGEADEWSCGQPCRMAVRKPQLTLRAAPTGFPTWGGDCTVAAGGGCSLVMDGTKVVSLQEIASAIRWEVRREAHPRSVAVATDGDILVQEVGQLLRFSSTGQVRWSVPLSGGGQMAVDGQGHIYVADFYGQVTRYDANGQAQWVSSRPGESSSWNGLAVSASGHVYVLVSLGQSETSRQFKLIALSPEGGERWSVLFDEGHFNYSYGMGVDARGEVFVSGGAYNRTATPGERVFVKNYYRKYSAEGALRWETPESWGNFAVNAEGATSVVSYNPQSPGGFSQWWIGASGTLQWNSTVPSSPGVIALQTFSSSGALLIGGHETSAGSTENGRGWFAAMNLTTRALGQAVYVEAPTGGPVRISGLTLTPTGNIAVIGGFGSLSGQGEGYLRMYDSRVLTTNPGAR